MQTRLCWYFRREGLREYGQIKLGTDSYSVLWDRCMSPLRSPRPRRRVRKLSHGNLEGNLSADWLARRCLHQQLMFLSLCPSTVSPLATVSSRRDERIVRCLYGQLFWRQLQSIRLGKGLSVFDRMTCDTRQYELLPHGSHCTADSNREDQ